MGHPSPNHQWDVHRLSWFFPTSPWARGTSISPRALHMPLVLHNQAEWARAYKPGLQGPRGLSTPSHLGLSLHISMLFRVHFYSISRLWERVLFNSGASYSFVAASCVKDLGLEVRPLEKPLHVSFPIGARVSVDKICWDYELEISGILLTVDLRVMDMSEFDVIFGMDWLTAHRVIIDYDRKRVTTYTPNGIRFMFQGDKHDALPQAVYDSRWHRQLMGSLASLTLEDEVRQELVYLGWFVSMRTLFLDELPGLPPHKDLEFTIELHLDTSPISMTS